MKQNFRISKRYISQLYFLVAMIFMLSSYTAIGQIVKADFFVATNGNDNWSGTVDLCLQYNNLKNRL